MQWVVIECGKCGNLDVVEDILIVIATHKCTQCGSGGGKVRSDEPPLIPPPAVLD